MRSRILDAIRGVAIWLVSGYFVLFAANGGARGSARVSGFAWACLAVYTVLFVLFFRARRRRP